VSVRQAIVRVKPGSVACHDQALFRAVDGSLEGAGHGTHCGSEGRRLEARLRSTESTGCDGMWRRYKYCGAMNASGISWWCRRSEAARGGGPKAWRARHGSFRSRGLWCLSTPERISECHCGRGAVVAISAQGSMRQRWSDRVVCVWKCDLVMQRFPSTRAYVVSGGSSRGRCETRPICSQGGCSRMRAD
jgi:hypothetical protein